MLFEDRLEGPKTNGRETISALEHGYPDRVAVGKTEVSCSELFPLARLTAMPVEWLQGLVAVGWRLNRRRGALTVFGRAVVGRSGWRKCGGHMSSEKGSGLHHPPGSGFVLLLLANDVLHVLSVQV